MSNWSTPSQIVQYSETGAEDVHIPWLETNNIIGVLGADKLSIRTTRDLMHIARDPKHDIMQQTYFLKITGFNFSNFTGPVTGIEMKLTMDRGGRITDDTIQLCLRDSLIGKNIGTLNLDPVKTYGADNDTWETNVSAEDILDPSFGIVLRFKSHPYWPHKSSALINAIALRIH